MSLSVRVHALATRLGLAVRGLVARVTALEQLDGTFYSTASLAAAVTAAKAARPDAVSGTTLTASHVDGARNVLASTTLRRVRTGPLGADLAWEVVGAVLDTTALRLVGGGQMVAGRHHVLDTTGGTTATTAFEGEDLATVDFATPASPATDDIWSATGAGPHTVRLVGPIDGDTDAVLLENGRTVNAVFDGATWRTSE